LGGAPELDERERAQDQRGEHGHLRHRATDLFAQEGHLDEAHARAAERFRHGDADQARLGERAPRLAIVPFAGRLEALQAIVGDVIGEDLPREVAQRFLVLRKVEIH
jgi:hypothetical protein